MSNYPQKIFNSVLDTIFPKICLGCDEFTEKGDFDYACRKCFREITIKNTLECVGCKRQTKYGLTCVSCKKDNPIGQLLIAAELMDPLVEKMLKAYKYKFICDMAVPLSVIAKKCAKKLLSKGFSLFEDSPLVIPVPLHNRRFNWRGFNQSELLAKNIADAYHVSYNAGVLARVAGSKHQVDIKSREERLSNIKNNFAVISAEAIRGRTVILIDDICTTGATLNECAGVLKDNGAKRVIGFVIARGTIETHNIRKTRN